MNILRRLNNTYQKVYRNRHLIAKGLVLDDPEYRLWDLYIALYDWDKSHSETFQTVEATDLVLKEILDWSISKVCRVRNRLLKKGAIKPVGRSIYTVSLLPQKENDIASLKNNVAQMQNEIAPMQEKIAEKQQFQGYLDSNTIVSYKGKYRINTVDEYNDIKNKVDELSKNIDEKNCWLSDKPEERTLVDEQQRLAGLMLNYEIENDLLPI